MGMFTIVPIVGTWAMLLTKDLATSCSRLVPFRGERSRSFDLPERDCEENNVASRFELHASPPAAFTDEVADEPTVPLDARPDAVLCAHGQNGHSPPTDAVVGVEDSSFELGERQRRPHPETL